MVLELEQSATQELIIKAYRRLALTRHPDRNAKHDATKAFQLLGEAYETLNDESRRRAYDLIYPSIKHSRSSTQAHAHRPTPAAPPPGTLSDAAEIVALQKSKQERSARWRVKKNAIDASISELRRGIRQLDLEILNLKSIAAAELAVEGQKNSWGTWLLSPFTKTVIETEGEKARKDIARQERRTQTDRKERRLEAKKLDLDKEGAKIRIAKEEVDAADRSDNYKVQAAERRILARDRQESAQREKQRAKEWQRFGDSSGSSGKRTSTRGLRGFRNKSRSSEK